MMHVYGIGFYFIVDCVLCSDMSGQEISVLSVDVFDILSNLAVLDLAENRLTTLPVDIFLPTTGLRSL